MAGLPPGLAAAVVLGLQRSAGNRAVAGLLFSSPPRLALQRACACGGPCGDRPDGERPEQPEVQRALPRDLQVRGKFSKAAAHPGQVFFDFDSSSLDGEEKEKIDVFLKTSPPPTAITAKASEEGGPQANEACARRRGEAVAGHISAKGLKRPQVVLAIDDALDVPDYRFMRRVDLAPPKGSEDRCTLDPGCDAFLVSALGAARTLAGFGRSAAADPQPPIRVALADVFRSGDDDTAKEVAKRFGFIEVEIEALTKPGHHECQTPCTEPTCREGNRAFLDTKLNKVVGCPDLKTPRRNETDKSPEETMLHEAVHGPGVEGSDAARLFEPLFPFLARAAALANPDSFVEFVRVVTTSRRTTPRKLTTSFDPSFGEDQKRAVDKALAWAIKRLIEAEEGVGAVYAALVSPRRNPARSAELLAGVTGQRSLFSRHFGTTEPTLPPEPRDQWVVQGISNRIHLLLLEAGRQPAVVQANGVTWSRRNRRLGVDSAFLARSVSEQARFIEFALIVDDPDIPAARRNAYMEVIDSLGGLDVSATEG